MLETRHTNLVLGQDLKQHHLALYQRSPRWHSLSSRVLRANAYSVAARQGDIRFGRSDFRPCRELRYVWVIRLMKVLVFLYVLHARYKGTL